MVESNAFDVDVIIVGAGPAGLGCAALLRQMQLPRERLLVLDAGQVGASFHRWPREMRLITPSFPANGFHQTDLNAITPDTSPAFSLRREHPTGVEYADYLGKVVDHYDIPVATQEAVTEVYPLKEGFELYTARPRRLRCRFVIWAGGEYGAALIPTIEGAEWARHNSELGSYAEQTGDHQIIIGGYESGIDAAWHWVGAGKSVTMLERRNEWEHTYDPSRVLSPISQERFEQLRDNPRFELASGREVTRIERQASGYRVFCQTGEQWSAIDAPTLCTGFNANLGPVESLFLYDDEGVPFTNSFDESTLVPGLFLTGSRLAYGDILLCFIYKFRGRFPVVCGTIGAELELDVEVMRHYQQAGMLLDDLSCCEDQQCFC
ncbi:NAD(P)-binding domain-containing protein [Halomonas sp. ML-15]|uniref:NAD(P)/FAD-dependent oxidoreductase n=1 Tax=Halomonas sp. ML-15 TaxID=2773305 RepID=UPI00174755D4|nr:NAD(P)/FAD-dependent oxidoreductase [Halomonas sp. ML-15]MBD3894910.1 NAD(P)-binding domain-containing protein [Halomonas sp. ML-15]